VSHSLPPLLPEQRALFEKGFASLRHAADVVVADLAEVRGGVPALNLMTGGYLVESHYEPARWDRFQWVGFLSGRLWLLSEYYRDPKYAQAAVDVMKQAGPVLAERAATFSPTGNDTYYGLAMGYKATGITELRDWEVSAARNFDGLFDPRARAFVQVGGTNRVVIDTGLNLPALFWAGLYDPERTAQATIHLDTVLRLGLVREDGSSFHAAAIDPETGERVRCFTLQGYEDGSTWARGQAWAILGYANGYEATGSDHYLDVALRAADWWVQHAPTDWVPYYDFDDPNHDSIPRDSCAAVVAATQLLRLARWRPDRAERYCGVARGTALELLRNYLSPGGVLLHGSWGRLRQRHGAGLGRYPQEDIMPYGNYWITEYLYRELVDDWSLLDISQRDPVGFLAAGGQS
jgi:unsaturated chondroitin disaccharide hydrolase